MALPMVASHLKVIIPVVDHPCVFLDWGAVCFVERCVVELFFPREKRHVTKMCLVAASLPRLR